ncbi:MAG: class I SAM-dependent methyltransferase [Planctomycetes bacterium]|nr:class I SAM-dependent methyltransferase [Planctomycetota bacterium]
MRRAFDLGARPYDVVTDNALWREQVARLLEPGAPPPRRLLDLGCGPGGSAFVLAERLPGARVAALDISRPMVSRARAHQRRRWSHQGGRVALLQADATHLPFADGAFDLVTGHSFLYLVPDPAAVLREVRRVLAPGGRVAFMEPSAAGSLRRAALAGLGSAGELVRRPLDAVRHAASMVTWRLYGAAVGRLAPARLERLLRDAGFLDVRLTPTLGGLGQHARARRGA